MMCLSTVFWAYLNEYFLPLHPAVLGTCLQLGVQESQFNPTTLPPRKAILHLKEAR